MVLSWSGSGGVGVAFMIKACLLRPPCKGMQMVCYKKACEPKTCAVVPGSFALEAQLCTWALSGNSG